MSPTTPEPGASLPAFDPARDELLEDPYPTFHRYRESDAVHRGASQSPLRDHQWWLFRYPDVETGLTDSRFGRDWRRFRELLGAPPFPESLAPVADMLDRWMLQREGETHARLRGVMNRAFTPRMVARLRPRIEALAEQRLAGVAGSFDVVEDYARPFAMSVIAELLGVPESERKDFARSYRDFLPMFAGSRDPEQGARAATATRALTATFRAMLAERRHTPQEDLVSGLAQEGAAERFSDDDAVGTCILVMGAGLSTVVSLIANSIHTLLRHPEQLATLADAPQQIEGAIDELMRFDGATDVLVRYTEAPIELGGHRIEAGALVGLVVGSANRDPEVFPDPDRLDLARDARRQLGFSRGPHFCLGASLARVEGAAALAALLRRRHTLRLGEGPARRTRVLGRGFERLSLHV